MSLISELIEHRKSSIDKPWQWPSLAAYFGTSTQAGVKVNEMRSLQLSAVYACVRLISTSIGMLPLSLHQDTGGGNSRVASDKVLNKLLLKTPNSEMTAYTFKQTMMANVLLWGNAYAEKIIDGAGQVVELWPLNPASMQVSLIKGKRSYDYKDADGKEITFRSNQIFHVPGLSFNGLTGMTPIAAMRNELGLGLALQDYGSKFFANGTHMGGALKHPGKLGEKARLHLKEDLETSFAGSGNAGKTIILEEGMEFMKFGMPADDAQFIESRKFQLEEIARYYGVQLHMIQNLDKATNNNIEQQSIEFKTYALGPWVATWEQEIFRSLLTTKEQDQKYFGKFNLNALMRGDYKTRMEGYRTGVQMGLYNLDEVRALEDLNPIGEEKGGDIHWVNSAMIPIDKQMEGGGQSGESAVVTANGDSSN